MLLNFRESYHPSWQRSKKLKRSQENSRQRLQLQLLELMERSKSKLTSSLIKIEKPSSKSSLIAFLSKPITAEISLLSAHLFISSVILMTPSCMHTSISLNFGVLFNVFVMSIVVAFILSFIC